MKTFAVLASLVANAIAQNAVLSLPNGASLEAGSEVIVQVQRPNSLTGSTEMGVAIGVQSCPESTCHPAESFLGTILYNGPFKPVYHETYNPPYENFSVTVPEGTPKGRALVGVAHATLVGAGPWPWLEVLNQTVTIV
ncbi:hypothetical protein P175DRAFT_0504944 [Aspergillus ochraceoroseus IBT 24754]|uniref:Uncharacterized protein n=3 Tax=Aspergillus subgen. Nidulantes TaxID=2720870 RepID=A0A0F8V6K2_9EURO|nr:uncharacterized protein P175DRAFT_0504944 [Aspergillus ochraceoroseus IBT 24754]KKK11913.1 hypothetical protein AOCH_004755 [Aspergillus ochraceoroseus]KKK27383.1 hypothetical protein ARAM_002294 [Aspergillus rambellii]PTU17184.1 hypothetical protein P175DRAFT_0504944 [Aspergillus ochraceoroseus IBT 24754]